MSNTKIETVSSTADRVKLVVAVLVIIAGIVGYSMLDGQSHLVRVGTFIGSLVIAAIIAWFSETGRRTVGFGKDSYNETKRVIWPTRPETTRMTAIVFAFVAAMGVLLWVVDKLLEWIIYGVLLGWK